VLITSRFGVATGSRTQSELSWTALTGSGRGVLDGAVPGSGGARLPAPPPDASSPPPRPGLVPGRRGLALGGDRVHLQRRTRRETPVTVTGSGFTNATGVRFGTVADTNLAVAGDTQLTVTSPPPTARGRRDRHHAGRDLSSASAADQFTYG